jgi:DNA mismatch repair protein MutS
MLMELEGQVPSDRTSGSGQLPLFPSAHTMLDDLEALSIDDLTPLEALNLLYEWQQRLRT